MTETVPPMARYVPLIAASALFVENIDATVLATALASIANDFGVDAVDLKLVLTCYLVSLAVFIPASGWIADRYGTRTVFCWAMAVFTAGSVACALSTGLWSLVFARILQGAGGAMMIPTARAGFWFDAGRRTSSPAVSRPIHSFVTRLCAMPSRLRPRRRRPS
jgi:MFS family permease